MPFRLSSWQHHGIPLYTLVNLRVWRDWEIYYKELVCSILEAEKSQYLLFASLKTRKKNTKYSFNQSLVVWASSQPFFTKVPDWGNNWHSTIIKQARSHLTLPVIYCLHWSSKNWCSNKFVSQEVVLIRAEGRHWVKG